MKSRSSLGAFERFPLFWMAVAFSGGILLQYVFQIDYRLALGALILQTAAWAALRSHPLAWYVFLVAIVLGGAGMMGWRGAESSEGVAALIDKGVIDDGDPIELIGTVVGLPEPSARGFFVTVAAETIVYKDREHATVGYVRLFAVAEDEARIEQFASMGVSRGAKLSAVFRVRRGDRYLNPGVLPMREILSQKGIDATGTLKSLSLLDVREGPKGGFHRFEPSGIRNRLIEEFRRLLSPETAGVIVASLLGDKYFLDKRTADLFREGGTFHVLVISGLHITFIGGLILWVAGLFTKSAWVKFLVSSLALWGFAFAVGGDIPVIRAAVMFTLLLFLRAMKRDSSSVNAFGASALVVLVWRPADLLSPSFILTFVCTGAIVSIAVPLVSNLREIGRWTPTKRKPLPPRVGPALKTLCETLYWREEEWQFKSRRNAWTARIFKSETFTRLPFIWRKFAARLFEGVLVSVTVQICLLPLQIRYFHRVATGGILLNLWVEAILAAETFTAVFAVVSANVSESLCVPFIGLTEFLNRALLFAPEVFADRGLASFRVPVQPFADVLAWLYLALGFPLAAWMLSWNPFDWNYAPPARFRKVSRAATILSIAVLQMVVVLHPFSERAPDGKLRIDFLDVGQGDSIFVTFPDGETMLIDGGGRTSFGADGDADSFEPDIRGVGEAVVSEFLWESGVSRIDYVVATHADADHMQGLADVARNFDIGRVYVARVAEDDPDFIDFSHELGRNSLTPELIARGDRLEIGGVAIDVLNPVSSAEPRATYGNAESIVLSLRFGSRRFLLTGDIEKEGEREMLERPASLGADLVKVAHHGSRTSSTEEFIRAVKPSYAIISVGRTSPFGHPHQEVVDRWTRSGAKVLSTGEKGTVTVETDGNSLAVRTFLGGG